ncbi:hypothetical protein PMAYCL1PPCAC_00388, partial [Pristionchus mayeri]
MLAYGRSEAEEPDSLNLAIEQFPLPCIEHLIEWRRSHSFFGHDFHSLTNLSAYIDNFCHCATDEECHE